MFVTSEQRKILALLLLVRRRRRRLKRRTRVVVSTYRPAAPYSPSPSPPRRPRPMKLQQQTQPQLQQQQQPPPLPEEQQQQPKVEQEGEDQKVEMVGVQMKQKKRLWVTPFLRARKQLGEYHRELRQDEALFMADFTLSVRQFDLLLDKISADIYRRDTCWREAIDPAERLAICLRYLATGDSYSSISRSFRVGKSTVVGILSTVADAIWNGLAEEFMPPPKRHDWRAVADEFGRRWDFPHCVGVLDAKHVVIKAPAHSKSRREHQSSVVLLAVVDADGLFRTADVGAFGRSSGGDDDDGDILSASALGKSLRDGTLDLPDDAPVPTAEHLGPVPYVFAADEALSAPRRNVLCPFPPAGDDDNARQRVFNYHLSRARGVAESAFAALAQQFRVYHRVMEVSPATAEKIVRATTVLHNFLRRDGQRGDPAAHAAAPPVAEWSADALRPVGTAVHSGSHCAATSQEALSVREKFTDYFNSPATAVAWLNDYV